MLVDKGAFSFYITTNSTKNVLYCGVTNDLLQRVTEHYLMRGSPKTFAGRFYCYWLLYYEDYQYADDAIAREKQVKRWRREKKEALISGFNREWTFLNVALFKIWPPAEMYHRKDLL